MTVPPMSASAIPVRLILASASPRRRELLSRLAIPFTSMPANIDERVLPDEDPYVYTRRVALAKARCIAAQCPTAVVLGADSIVVIEQQILGKPQDAADARRMLRRLSGQQHMVLTGLAVLRQDCQLMYCDVVRTGVRFHPLTPEVIDEYIATGEPMDKAGSYAIQGAAAAFVEAREGCYTNVIGLPLRRTATLLQLAGIHLPILPGHNEQTAS